MESLSYFLICRRFCLTSAAPWVVSSQAADSAPRRSRSVAANGGGHLHRCRSARRIDDRHYLGRLSLLQGAFTQRIASIQLLVVEAMGLVACADQAMVVIFCCAVHCPGRPFLRWRAALSCFLTD